MIPDFLETGEHIDKDETGKVLVKQNGQILKDEMESPKDYKEVLANFAKDNGWLINTEGRGEGNQHGSHDQHKTRHDLMREMKEKNIDPTSKQGLDLITSFENKA